MNNNLQLLPVNELMQYSFFVPSYQRGYRWTDVEVTALLKDLFTFMNKRKDEDDFYCLQPIVLARNIKNDSSWDLIDGQQRLTTIFLILKFLSGRLAEEYRPKVFSLEYQTRTESGEFLSKINESLKDTNIDYYHIYNSYESIKNFFADKMNLINRFEDTLLNKTYLIWFETNPENAIEVFTRINIGKIPLTNAELIKALFLKSENFKSAFEIKQIQISAEWDEMEKNLRDPRFWYFLNSTRQQDHYENHIDYIFDLIATKSKKQESEKLHSFLYYYSYLGESHEDIEAIVDEKWLEVKKHFHKLNEWFQDKELYHYIGFLIEQNEIDIDTAIKNSNTMDKDAFAIWILGRIKKSVGNIDIDELSFDDHKAQIRKILLLFNIETLLQTEKATFWFPFDKYKLENWDIEHVNSRTQTVPDSKNYMPWLTDLLEYFTGFNKYSDEVIEGSEETYRQAIDQMIINLGKDEQTSQHKILLEKIVFHLGQNYSAAIEELFHSLYKFFKEGEISENDGIENLALLDATTNRSYKNAMFPIKRKRIINNDKNGIFIPIATKNLFLKYYSNQMGQVLYWTKKDANEYGNAIRKVLSKYSK